MKASFEAWGKTAGSWVREEVVEHDDVVIVQHRVGQGQGIAIGLDGEVHLVSQGLEVGQSGIAGAVMAVAGKDQHLAFLQGAAFVRRHHLGRRHHGGEEQGGQPQRRYSDSDCVFHGHSGVLLVSHFVASHLRVNSSLSR
jgi:hypothetical protein